MVPIKGLAKNAWNLPRKIWYSWLRRILPLIAIAVAVGFLTLAIFELAQEDWSSATAWFVAGGPLLVASIGHGYLAINEPQTVLCTSIQDIKTALRNFISRGESAHIASNRLSWLRGDASMTRFLVERSRAGQEITVFASRLDAFPDDLKEPEISLRVYSPEPTTPRFTLLNVGRAGGASMAVARGVLPDFWIDIYDERHHPQVIALARAYISQLDKSR